MNTNTHTCSGPSAHVTASEYCITTALKMKDVNNFSAGWQLPRQLKTELRGLFKLLRRQRERRDAEVTCRLEKRENVTSQCALWNANDLSTREIAQLKCYIFPMRVNPAEQGFSCRNQWMAGEKQNVLYFVFNLSVKGSCLANIWKISNSPDCNHGNPHYLLGYFSLPSQRETAW